MSEEELKAQELSDEINKIAVEIEKIEETAKKKNAYIENKIREEFDPKISEIEVKLQDKQTIFNTLVNKIDDLSLQKKELIRVIKNLELEYKKLKKAKKKLLKENIKAIAKEKKTKTKEIDRNIKVLERELKKKNQ